MNFIASSEIVASLVVKVPCVDGAFWKTSSKIITTAQYSPLTPLIPLFLLQPLNVQLGPPKHVSHLGLHGNGRGGAQGVSRCMRCRIRGTRGKSRHVASQRLIHRLAF